MKFDYEKLEEIEGLFNPLLDKCNMLLGSVYRELSKILRELSSSNMYTYVRWEFGDHLKSVDKLSITENGLDLGNNGVTLHMFSEEFEDGILEFIVPYEWLELEDDEASILAKNWIRNEVKKFIDLKNIKITKFHEANKEDLISRMKSLEKEDIVEIIKELPERNAIVDGLLNNDIQV